MEIRKRERMLDALAIGLIGVASMTGNLYVLAVAVAAAFLPLGIEK